MRQGKVLFLVAVCAGLFVVGAQRVAADDSCVFSVTADSVPPNIVLLLDNGAEMEQIIWHSSYNNSVSYTPGGGGVFTNSYGYAVVKSGNDYYLRPIESDLDITSVGQIVADANNTPTWTINGRKVTLPADPSTAVDGDGIKDNATVFRYSTNYLNWIFYSAGWTAAGEPGKDVAAPFGTADGTALPSKSRFYYAKQAIFSVAKETANKANFGVHAFTSNANGASNVQPLGLVVSTPLVTPSSNNTLQSNFVNTINNMGTVTDSPLAEGLASVGGYYASPSSHVVGEYCQKNFVIVVTPGVSSEDEDGAAQSVPVTLSDVDGDSAAGGIGEGNIKKDGVVSAIPVNDDGTTYLDDVAYYLATHDVVGYQSGTQNVFTYTVGFMGSEISKQFLINTSNNGNGNLNLYDSTDPDYGKYHFDASSPDDLAEMLQDAINTILEKTNAFAAPVVPITRTTSGNRLYMSFFTPSGSSNFWEGNVMKLGLNSNLDVVDKNGAVATESNGALKETAEPYWATIDWADTSKDNGVLNTARNIYTYLGTTTALTNAANHFKTSNATLTAAVLGTPTHTTTQIINYIRGADVFDEDSDTNIAENRALITGDVLHSEPLVVQFIHSAGALTLSGISGSFQDNEIIRGGSGGYATANGALSGATLNYDDLKSPFTVDEQLRGLSSGAVATISAVPDVTMIFYGANDGMLHAVRDTNGTEAWAFIPPNQLSRLKDIVEGVGHQSYVDGSAKAYLYDVNDNGFMDTADGDKMLLICGERKGSDGYFALDITTPESPLFLWRINRTSDLAFAAPNQVIAELGESWADPLFGKVKTTAVPTGVPVFFIGGGYSSGNTKGKAVLAINVLTGAAVKTFKNDTDGNALTGTNITGMDYSIPSNVRLLDTDSNGFIDKVYVGDMGGQLWRIGRFTDAVNVALGFPSMDENIDTWRGQKLFTAGCNESSCTDSADNNTNGLVDERRKFFYAPSVVLERGYDLVYIASGDRENPCHGGTSDEAYAIKDDHTILPTTVPPPSPLGRTDLVDVTNGAEVDVDGSDKGWLLSLATGEKALSEGTVFAGYYIFSTFLPTTDACVPGGNAYLYIVNYKTGVGFFADDADADTQPEAATMIGGGIPSRPVIVLSDSKMAIYTSVGSTNPDESSPSTAAGITAGPNVGKTFNYFLLWWKGLYED